MRRPWPALGRSAKGKKNLCEVKEILWAGTNMPDAGLLARSQYSEGPATGHLDTGFS